jgi:thiamine monophosphate synthase
MVGTSASSEAQLLEALAAGWITLRSGRSFRLRRNRLLLRLSELMGVRRFREVAGPGPVLVAAAGITLETAPAILEAGANAVAVSSAIFSHADPRRSFGAGWRVWDRRI